MSEKVLVFPKETLEKYLPYFNGSILPADETASLLQEKGQFYMDRDEAESDPNFKQIIPYCVLSYSGEYFVYQRTPKGGEKRLHGKRSIGVGGHINPCDEGNDSYINALRRELEEEVGIGDDSLLIIKTLGGIYDPSNDVGRVHFGVVHLVKLNESSKRSMKFVDPSLANGTFGNSLLDLKLLNGTVDGYFENWSKLIIEQGVLEGC